MKEPVDHIERPVLPWRNPGETALTECGYKSAAVKTISRAEFMARFKEYGERRTAILTCMTCVDTARRWRDWDTSPIEMIAREIQWEGRWGKEHGHRFQHELRAMALLIAGHRSEFVSLCEMVQDVDFCQTQQETDGTGA